MFFQPLPGLVVLAGGAMSVAAGTKDAMQLSTLLALIDCYSIALCAAVNDGVYDFMMVLGHGITIAFDILGTIGSENISYCFHL